jgi:hypothetical protein
MALDPLTDDDVLQPRSAGPRVDISIVASDGLSHKELDALWRFTARRMDATRESVEARLRELPNVALFRERSAEAPLVGIASLDVQRVTFENQARIVVFATNVMLDERYRTSDLLVRLGLRVFLGERRRHPLQPIDWLIATSERECYALLPRHFFRFWPKRDVTTCDWARAYLDFLMRQRYGTRWRPRQGTVTALADAWRPRRRDPVESCADPDARYFDALNMGRAEGDMLVCLCPLSIDNWIHAAARVVRRWRTPAPRGVIRSSAPRPGQ